MFQTASLNTLFELPLITKTVKFRTNAFAVTCAAEANKADVIKYLWRR